MEHWGFLATTNALWLLVKMVVVANGCPTPKSATRRQTHSTIAMKAALYSASQLEVAIVGCFLLNHDMHELPSMKQKPLVDTRVS